MKDIEIIDIDYSGKNPEFKKSDIVDIAEISSPWIVPEEGPIYGDSVRVIKGGLPLVPGTDYQCVEELPDLTMKTGKSVYLYVQLKDHILTSGGEVELEYQRVGMPIISTKTLLDMLEDMIIKGKPVDWETGVENKPLTYYPSWHSHDVKNPDELVGFGGLVELFSRLTWEQQRDGIRMKELLHQLQTEIYEKLNYTHKLKWGAIMTHSRDYNNPHGLKATDVDAGNIANNATATPQEDSEGKRDDLYSTPPGLKRLIEESEPDTEDYLVQNELPFGYYGSGIYLPPPITGSFEGLGGDIENSAFLKEGNGWTVGLIRGYDGRVKNLYYIYNEDIDDRTNTIPWIHTYVQYQHPVVSAAGKQPNVVISGSNQTVLCLGSCDNLQRTLDPAQDKYWVCVPNSTFDPASHTLKEINLPATFQGICRSGQLTVAHVNDWVYVIAAVDGLGNDLPANNNMRDGLNNWGTHFYRFPYSDLTNDAKTSITITRVNVTYDNLYRERRSGDTMFMMRQILDGNQDVLSSGIRFSRPFFASGQHRRRAFIVVPNPNNPRLAKVKVLSVTWNNVKNLTNEGVRGLWQDICIDYDWDVVSNTWTLNSNWKMPLMDAETGGMIEIDNNWVQPSTHSLHTKTFADNAGSWIPGFGWLSLCSHQTGTAPYYITLSKLSRDGDPLKDYEWMSLPINWWDIAGRHNAWTMNFVMRSPFGVAGFPRYYTDLYSLTSGMRQSPIEVFWAENEQVQQTCFYRITEGGADDQYDYRDPLQSDYIPLPIYGRKTNSNFGRVNGLTYNMGLANRPRRKNEHSRQQGLFGYIRRNVKANPGARYEFTWRPNADGNQIEIPMESNGDIIIDLLMDWNLDPASKILFVRPNKAKQVRVPRSIWMDMVNQALGAHLNDIVDIAVSFYISSQPGSGGDQPFSMWSCHYHLASDTARTRSIIGMFTWDVASTAADGIRVIRLANMQYPFKTAGSPQFELRPGFAENISAGNGYHAINSDGTWAGLYYGTGLTVRYPHMEILDFEAEGPQNLEQAYMPGLQVNTPGNAATPRIFFKRRNNVLSEATMAWGAGHAFNEYPWQVQANPQHGWVRGQPAITSGGAIDLMVPWKGPLNDWPVAEDKFVMLGATYVEGNWSLFVNSAVTVTFNGFSMDAKLQNWDLRDLTDVYKNQTFYIYCCANGSSAYYEITKILRNHDSNSILVGTVKTDDFGIVTIERRQTFTISGFPITRSRDMGVPASSGALTEQGSYRFLKRSELYIEN